MSRRRPPPTALRALQALLAMSVLLAAGCAAPRSPRWHSLLPALPAPATEADLAAAARQPTITMSLAQPVVPVQVDQPQWLVRLPDQSLALLEDERWASPLRDELRAALREQLARRWAVTTAASSADSAVAWRVDVELLRFESIPAQAAWIDARWTLTPPRGSAGKAVSCGAVLREPVADGSMALAEGHRRAVARLADRIGRQLRQGGGSDCGADPG